MQRTRQIATETGYIRAFEICAGKLLSYSPAGSDDIFPHTERTKHVEYLATQLVSTIKNVIALTGGGTQKANRDLFEAVANIPADEPFVLVATDKYVGEGFDMPRLDTLFLTMSVSWKGTIQQYAGRLCRLYDGKRGSDLRLCFVGEYINLQQKNIRTLVHNCS